MSDLKSRFEQMAAPGVRTLKPYQPGKPVEALEREYGVRNAVKLASNENPLGPSPLGAAAAQAALAGVNYYPDPYKLIDKLAARHSVSSQCVTIGNGSNDVLDMIARAFLTPAHNSVFSTHAFAVYPLATMAVGAQMRIAPALPANHATMPYGHDLDAMAALIDADTRVVWIANPNNPTGTWVEKAALKAFIDTVPKTAVVVLDEAYIEYVSDAEFADGTAWLADNPNLIVTRTFSKIYGLAGLRIGYGLSSPEVADYLNRVRQPFNANNVAIAAALAAMDDSGFLARSAQMNRDGLAQLQAGCDALGLAYVPSRGNFLTVDFGQPADAIYDALLHEGVILRPLQPYQMPNHLRVTVGTESDNQRVLAAFKKVLAEVRGG